MKPLYLRFDSEDEARGALLSNGFALSDDGGLNHPECALQMIGIIRGNPIYDDFFNVIGNEPDIEGYHVNLLVPDGFIASDSGHIIDVATPAFKWAGY